MKQKITCFCDNAFEIDYPEEIDLDANPELFEQIQNGSFMNFVCESCKKKHKPEFQLSVLWPSRKIRFEVFPELSRGDFYRRKKTPPEKGRNKLETIIGFPELADRLAVMRDGFDPVPIEAIKYILHLKAEEQYPDDEMEIFYYSNNGSTGDDGVLEFHIHGIRENEVAVMKVPYSLYKKTLEDSRRNRNSELFSALRVRTYLSVKNTMMPEEMK